MSNCKRKKWKVSKLLECPECKRDFFRDELRVYWLPGMVYGFLVCLDCKKDLEARAPLKPL